MSEHAPPPPTLSRPLQRRLRELWRSAGWPCHDNLEPELLAGGMVERVQHGSGHETLRVTDAGIAELARGLQRNRAALSAHEALVQRVAHLQLAQGRVAYTGLSLRARVELTLEGEAVQRWQMVRPDVFSIRHTSVAEYVQPVVHEIKVSRADLLGDVRNPAKRAGYLWLSSACFYVLAEGIGTADDVPPECGVLLATPDALELLRPARTAQQTLPFAVWMALARATPVAAPPDEAQAWLGGEGPTGVAGDAPAPDGAV